MKRKGRTTLIILVILILVVIVIWPAAPLWAKLGADSICIQGEFPHLKITNCESKVGSSSSVNHLEIPTPGSEGPIPIIFDDDGSPDGMIALMYFLQNPLFDVKAVTISCGEAHPEIFAPQLQQLLAGLDRADIPVGIGRTTPLQGNNAFPDPWRQVSDDFWGINLPDATVTMEPVPAAGLIIDILKNSNQPVMVFISGNHTNLAEALRLEPSIEEKIRQIHVMGGSVYIPGNIKSDWPSIDNSLAEWNIWVDPVAAKEVFASGIPIHLSPLDATRQVTWNQADVSTWIDTGTPEGILAADLLQWMLDNWSPSGVFIWDLVAAVNATDPSLCPDTQLAIDIVTEAGSNQGQTVVVNQTPNTHVCLDPDSESFKSLAAMILGK